MPEKNVLYLNRTSSLEDFFNMDITDTIDVDSFEEYLLKIDTLDTNLPKTCTKEEPGMFPMLFKSKEKPRHVSSITKKELYRPKQVRNKGSLREGYCEECNKWFRLKTSSYWYHMNYKHGINSEGLKYPEPGIQFNKNKIESYCVVCKRWICLGHQKNSKSYKFNWYRHWQRDHKDSE